ncbi:N-acetylglucosamine kinase [Paenibacillus nasutitermitis]|uniref:Kinase n=1 Tax=Paenibacillus nasutitermitis TaxID=1652958 RepID=A0A917E343_9BACL|nr:BadF/BadG/BcrA/BcrD ATPase family protein [Paenibacillus nasutitermitis]GGD95898.1 kinase [Paenibacillus nasutitermitis]
MAVIIGVDGGGSKTHAVAVDEEGRLLGVGLSGAGNHQSVGLQTALHHIQDSIGKALAVAGLTTEDIDFVQFGLAGADRDKDFGLLRPALATLPFRQWDLVCDTMEGLRIGSPDNTGVVLVCGTGTNAAGRNAGGATVQTGGFGYLYGDAAGGSDMAESTFRAAVRSWELRDIPSMLTESVPHYLGYRSMEEMWNDYLDRDIYEVSRDLTLVLHQTADEGDELASSLLRQTGRELALSAISVIRRLGMEDQTVPVVLIGSVLQKGRNRHLLAELSATLTRANMSYELNIPEMEPVYGSVMLAMDRMNMPVSAEMAHKFIGYGGYDN